MTENALMFEELENQSAMVWWGHALAGAAGIGCGVVVYILVATATAT